jgi:hypothetical protein
MHRQIACTTMAKMCVASQLTYLQSKKTCAFKHDETTIKKRNRDIQQQWDPKRSTYFDPHWLKTTLHFREQRSATFDIDPKRPLSAWNNAIGNLEFNNPGEEWSSTKDAFYGLLIVLKEDTSHAIAIRKSHLQHYFIHDIYTEAQSATAIDGCDGAENNYPTKEYFNNGINTHLTKYTANGYTSLFVIKLIKEKPFAPFIQSMKGFFL